MADAPQDLVADEVSVLVVDLLEAVEVEQHERDRGAEGAAGALDLPREPIVQGGVVEAARERVGARGLGEAGADRGVVEGDRGELGERLERFELPPPERHPRAVRHREHAAQLPAPVHRDRHRGLDVLPRRARPGAADVAVVLGEHRAVREQDLPGEPVAGGQAVPQELRRQPVGGLERQRLRIVIGHAVDDRDVGADQLRGLLADAGQERAEVGRGVQDLRCARERGVLVGGTARLEPRGLVREGGGRGARERAGERERLLAGDLVLLAREHERAIRQRDATAQGSGSEAPASTLRAPAATPRTGTSAWPATASTSTIAATGSRSSVRASAASAPASAASPGCEAWISRRATSARLSGVEPRWRGAGKGQRGADRPSRVFGTSRRAFTLRPSRRGGRVAEGTRLLSEYGEAISIAGSNPALSARGGYTAQPLYPRP